MLDNAVYNTSEVCHKLGIYHVVLSPGSRNAPLTVSFARNEKIKKWIIPDERTAGFIALGIAQELKQPVALCCTSGTALLNYAPAVTEAYYRQIPLVVLSADRPINLIDQRDGQTIRQFGVLKNHVKNSYQLPEVKNGTQAEYLNKLIEGILHAIEIPTGPVHLNIPFNEPFYPTEDQHLNYINFNITIPVQTPEDIEIPIVEGFKKPLILIGQQDVDEELSNQLSTLSSRIPVLESPLNNLRVNGIRYSDLFIGQQPELVPDLLITSGLSVLSKKLKNYIRKNKPIKHLHFDPAGIQVDTYQSEPTLFKADIKEFLKNWNVGDADSQFLMYWKQEDERAKGHLDSIVSQSEFSELTSFETILKSLPKNCNLHLGNSMPVRYADIFGVRPDIQAFSNRGTSGIDGITSTALGASMVSDRLNVLITGDISFFYDRNAFFHNHAFPNIRIIVMNNQGGGIFRLIDGPSKLPELEDYFETRHKRTAKYVCLENEIDYLTAQDQNDLITGLEGFYSDDKPKLLEIFTKPEINQKVYRELRRYPA